MEVDQVNKLLEGSGVVINGTNPWDPHIHDTRTLRRVLSESNLGLGEAYMDGWWDCEDIPELFHKLLTHGLVHDKLLTFPLIVSWIKARLINEQSSTRAKQVAEAHYDIGNDLYTAMLDSRMTYTCGYWSGSPKAKTLNEAQEAKLDLVCRKLHLKGGERILDIGCGWGSFAKFAAEKYGASVVGTTVSAEQVDLAREMCKDYPIEIRLEDYRLTSDGPYDHIVSLGMFEHVGYKNYRTYMKKVHELLQNDGLFLLHTIGGNVSGTTGEPWLNKYIFPNGMLPSIAQVGKSIEYLFVMEDWHNFGADYDLTLQEWFKNFDRAYPSLKDTYDQRFYRMWKYYLLFLSGVFRARQNLLWQIVLSKNGVREGYQSIR
jgi:cyclopropane-fatty-acyl-phospholipid synthase